MTDKDARGKLRDKRICGIFSLLLLLTLAGFITWVYKDTYDTFQEARIKCRDRMWRITRDSPWIDVAEVNLNSPDTLAYYQAPNQVEDSTFTCSERSADTAKRFEERFQILMYIFFLPLWLPIVLLAVTAWWLYHEFMLIYQRARAGKRKA